MSCYSIGIDTSCYTTSVAILDEAGELVADLRRILKVKAGARGLQQSEMVYQHTRNLPDLFEEAFRVLGKPLKLKAVGVSAYPRPLPDSFMPAFLVGEGFGRVLAASHSVPLYRISHQENHIFAGIRSANGPKADSFLAVHLSGGTTEVVHVSPGTDGPGRLKVDILGSSSDIHAGQLIDRIGVVLGLNFPAGPHLEVLAKENEAGAVKIPLTVRAASVSFAGPETYARRLIDKGTEAAVVAASVQLCIARAVTDMITYARGKTGLDDVLLVGGVMANNYIRSYVTDQLKINGARLFFPDNAYSPDNATGAAYFALNGGQINI